MITVAALIVLCLWRITKDYDENPLAVLAVIVGGVVLAVYEIRFWVYLLTP